MYHFGVEYDVLTILLLLRPAFTQGFASARQYRASHRPYLWLNFPINQMTEKGIEKATLVEYVGYSKVDLNSQMLNLLSANGHAPAFSVFFPHGAHRNYFSNICS